jgi:hypothetical protein
VGETPLRGLLGTLEAPAQVDLVAGIESRLSRRRRRRAIATAGFSLAALLCLGLFWPRAEPEVRIKGPTTPSPESWTNVDLYRLEPGGTPQPLAGRLAAGDSLLFTYLNGGPRPFTHLLVFGVASTGQVFWYFPAWLDAAEDPAAIPISASHQAVELHEQISHALPPGRFVVYSVFARSALRASEIEKALGALDAGSPLVLPDTVQQQQVVEVF